MKKVFSLLIISLLIICLFSGCGRHAVSELQDEKLPAGDDNGKDAGKTQPPTGASWTVDFVMRDAAVGIPLSAEDSASLEELLSADNWVGDLTNCASDVFLKSDGGAEFCYHSSCGTFNDSKGCRSLHLSDEDRERINGILSGYDMLELDMEIGTVSEPSIYAFSAQYIRTDGYTESAEYPRVTVIDSRAELEGYYDANKGIYNLERRETAGSDSSIGFLDACDKYDDGYFEKNNLILIVLEDPSGSIRHEVTEVRHPTGTEGWRITVKNQIPEVGTADMAEWHILLEIQMGNVIEKGDDISIVFE